MGNIADEIRLFRWKPSSHSSIHETCKSFVSELEITESYFLLQRTNRNFALQQRTPHPEKYEISLEVIITDPGN